MTQKLICAWISRHAPTVNQIASLHQYEIVQIKARRRFTDAKHAWDVAVSQAGGKPDLLVVVLPQAWIAEFVALAHIHVPAAPVLRAWMLPPDFTAWSGNWQALFLRAGQLDWYVWTPEAVR